MDRRTHLVIGLATLALLCAGTTLWAAEKDEGSGLKIGFVNLKKVFEDYERSKTMEKEIEAFQEEEAKKLEKTKKSIEEYEKELDLVKKNSKEWFKIRMDIVRKKKELETNEKLAKIEITRRLLKATEEIYEDILLKIKEYAKAKGYVMVLKIETGKIESDSSVELSMKVNSRGVLFYREDLDITTQIVTELNTAYTGKPPKKPGDGGKKPGDGDKKPGDGDKKPGDGDKKPGDGDKKAGEEKK